jgi:nucleoside-diphosphate-sugar epimerase
MPDRVLVTGATGFVGSHISQAFVGAGYEVRCGVRAASDPRWISGLPIERVPLDLKVEPVNLHRALAAVDLVVHAAGITRARREEDYRAINAEGTRKLAAAACEAGVRRFVLISSLAARGPDQLAGDGHDHPESAYGRSKLEAETHLRGFDEQMETVILRPAAVYGPRDTDLLPLFKMASAGWLPLPSAANLLQPVYAEDMARAALAAACKDSGTFAVAEAASYTWGDVVTGLEKALGRNIRGVRVPAAAIVAAGRAAEWAARPFSAVPFFDERRARDLTHRTWTCDVPEKALGWRAEVALLEGLERTALWYRQAGWLSMKTR